MSRALALPLAWLLVAGCGPQRSTPETAAQPSPGANQNATHIAAGQNPVDLSMHPPLRAWVDSTVFTARGLLVRQDLSRERSTIAGYTIRNNRLATLSRVELRRALQVELEGIDGTVTLCAPPREADPAPCIPPTAVSMDSRVTRVGEDGALHFGEQLSSDETAALGDSVQHVRLAIAVAGRELTEL